MVQKDILVNRPIRCLHCQLIAEDYGYDCDICNNRHFLVDDIGQIYKDNSR